MCTWLRKQCHWKFHIQSSSNLFFGAQSSLVYTQLGKRFAHSCYREHFRNALTFIGFIFQYSRVILPHQFSNILPRIPLSEKEMISLFAVLLVESTYKTDKLLLHFLFVLWMSHCKSQFFFIFSRFTMLFSFTLGRVLPAFFNTIHLLKSWILRDIFD